MNLSQVLEGVPVVTPLAASVAATEVRGLAYDSRKVEPGYLFFAFSGAKVDGAQYAEAALQKGAVAVVSDRPASAGFPGTWLQVPHGRHALATASRNFYHRPDERLALIAITGTNGKTTSSLLLDSMLRAAGKITALIGTIEYHLAGRVLPAVNTTPESLDLFRMFHELEQEGGTHATLEASSHALDLGRIYAMQFHTAAFTNFTRDHLDYHQTMESYLAAKQLLYKPRTGPPPRFAVLNADDVTIRRLEIAADTTVLWYGIEQPPPKAARSTVDDTWVRAVEVDSSFGGLAFHSACGRSQVPCRIEPGWSHQRLQHSARLFGGAHAWLKRKRNSERTD